MESRVRVGVNGKGSDGTRARGRSVDTVLVVAEDSGIRESLAAVLARAGMQAVGATASEALAMQALHHPAVAIVQYPPKRGSVPVAQRLKEHDPETHVLLLTEPAALEGASAMSERVDGYLVKPLTPPAFVQTVRSALAHRRLAAENRILLQRLEHDRAEETATVAPPREAPVTAAPDPMPGEVSGLVAFEDFVEPDDDVAEPFLEPVREFAAPFEDLMQPVEDVGEPMAGSAPVADEESLPPHGEVGARPPVEGVDDRLSASWAPRGTHQSSVAVFLIDAGAPSLNGSHPDPSVLEDIEARLSRRRRKSDSVTRLESGRFVMVCGEVSSPDDATRIAGSIVTELSLPVIVEGDPRRPSPTLGVVLAPADTRPEALFHNAGLALRCAQEDGRSWQMYDESVEKSFRLKEEMRAAIDRDEIGLSYQRIVDLQTREVVGAEVAIEWPRSQEFGLSAEDFMEAAHRAGLAVPLGQWAVNRLLSEFDSGRRRASLPERFGLWVAVSAEELADPEFAETFERLIVAHAVPSNAIVLEIPEGSLGAAVGAVPVVERLSKLGVSFVVDDYGASQADLSLLGELPIAGLRIASDLVADLDLADRRSPALVRGLIALGHELHLEVLGQGVTTQAQVVALRAMGCNLAQGHALGDPGTFDQLWGPIDA